MRMKGSDWQGILKLNTKLFSNKAVNLVGERINFSTTDAGTTRYRHEKKWTQTPLLDHTQKLIACDHRHKWKC